MPSEFSAHEVPLYPGHVVGIRAMLMEEGGRLYSPQQHYLWSHGENKAGCLYFSGVAKPVTQLRMYSMTSNGVIISASERSVTRADHVVAKKDCTCGFYAYFDDDNAHSYLPGYDGIYAIVKGYGRVTYGTHGFRAEKMELLALVKTGWDPHEEPEKPEPPKPVSTRRYVVGWVFSFLLLILGIVATFKEAMPFPLPSVLAWSGTGMGILIARRYRRRSQAYHEEAMKFAKDSMKWIQWQTYKGNHRYKRSTYNSVRVAKTSARYPDLPVYDTVEEALKDYVLTDPQSIK